MGVSAVDLIARLGSLGSDSGCNTACCHSPTQPNHSEKPGPDDDLLQVAALDQGIYTFGIGTTNTASDSDAPLVISSAFFVIRLLLAAAVLYGSSNRSRECDILAMLRSHCRLVYTHFSRNCTWIFYFGSTRERDRGARTRCPRNATTTLTGLDDSQRILSRTWLNQLNDRGSQQKPLQKTKHNTSLKPKQPLSSLTSSTAT